MSEKGFYIKSLDGIRAVAVMLVFISHAGFSDIVPGGFGVTIFFFLSGYLITTLLRLEYEKSKDISYRKFYLRRVYRIFPPLYVVLVLVLLLAYWGIVPHDMQATAVISQFFHFTNYYAIYFSNTNFIPGTGVLWSLAVEEHFYLVFPLLFLVMIKNMSYRNVAITLSVFCMAILLWRCYLVFDLGISQPHTYKATDSRIDSIMYGAIMGVFANPALDEELIKSVHAKALILAASLGILLFCLLYRNPEFRESFRYTLQGIALFPVFYLSVSQFHWPIFKWLNWKPIRYIGAVSYTFYLFHQTGLSLAAKMGMTSKLDKLSVAFVITLVFSALMRSFIEKKFSQLRKILHS